MSTFSARKPPAKRTKLDFTEESNKIIEFFVMKWSVGAGFRRNGRITDSRINGHGTGYPSSYRIDAGDIGGGRLGNPRQSRIFRIASGGFTAQRIRIVLPHLLHFNASTEKTRFKRSAQE